MSRFQFNFESGCCEVFEAQLCLNYGNLAISITINTNLQFQYFSTIDSKTANPLKYLKKTHHQAVQVAFPYFIHWSFSCIWTGFRLQLENRSTIWEVEKKSLKYFCCYFQGKKFLNSNSNNNIFMCALACIKSFRF